MSLSSTPVPRSRTQILGDMLDSFSAAQGITRLKVGGPILSVFEAASQSDAKQIAVVLQSLQARDLDAIQGLALDSYGNSSGVPRLSQRTARSSVDVTDTSFSKVQGQISPAYPAPIVGSNTIAVTRSDSWLQAPITGSLYLGRGTSHYEGPISYTDITDNGTYLTFSLATPTTQFHNQGEGTTRSQGGDRSIGPGTVVATAQGALATAVQFSTLYQYNLPDGEVEVDGLEVVCTTPGSIGNVPAGAIIQFQGSPPFTGATVTNPNSISNGRDVESDEDYRTRIKQLKANPQRGTDQSIINAVVGLQDSLGETISAASIIRKVNGPSTLFIDDGTGYEETSSGIGIEVLMNQAAGGETEFQTSNHQLAKAFSVSNNSGPYVLSDGAFLGALVGGIESVHTFSASEFLTVKSASPYEVVNSINGDSTILFSARTINNGTQFVIEARSETNEDIEVAPVYVGVDANYSFQFPVSRHYTTSLYKNDRCLSKDGKPATVHSQDFGKWNVLGGSQTLNLAIDQTPPTTYTFTDEDFVDYSKGFNAIGKNSLVAWADVFNSRLPGITTSVFNGQLVLTSNKGNNTLAQITIVGGTLVSNGMFLAQTVEGQDKDYILDRATGKILLTVPLAVGDKLTLGSDSTRPFFETPRLGTVSIADTLRMWVSADSDSIVRQNGVSPGTLITPTVTGVNPTTYQISLVVNAAVNPFVNIEEGDWAIFYDYSGETGLCPDSLKHSYKVVGTGISGNNYSVIIEKPEAKVPRYETALVTLNDGRIMAIGGKTQAFDTSTANADNPGGGITGTCEIFTIGADNTKGSWAFTAPLNVPRAGHTATVLVNGKVLVVGGRGVDGTILSSTELYDPTANTWTVRASFSVPVVYHTATILNSVSSGRVLVVGGLTTGAIPASFVSAEYDSATNTWINSSTLGTVNEGRYKHAALRLNCASGAKDGFVMIAGGWNTSLGDGPLSSAQTYNPSSHTWTYLDSMPSTRESFSLVQWSNATPFNVMAVGSSSRIPDQNSTYSVYSVADDSWGADTTISQQMYGVSGATVIFENSRIGSLYDSGAGTWDLLMPYARIDTGGALCFTWSGSDWTPIADPLSLGPLNERVRGDVWPVELGDSYGSNTCIFLFGGYGPINVATNTFISPYSTHELFTPAQTWNYPSDAVVTGGFTLTDTTGLVFISKGNLAYAEIAAGSYLASSLVSSLSSQLEGFVASVYRTSALRLATANYQGDLLIAANSDETNLPLSSGILVEAQEGQNGTVLSGSSAAGTPLDFTIRAIDYQATPSVSDSVLDLSLSLTELPLGSSVLMGLKAPGSLVAARSSNWQGYRANIATVEGLGLAGASYDSVRLGLRAASNSLLNAGDPVVLASPLHISPYDDFSVIVDKDSVTGLFNIPLARKVVPGAGTDYGSTVTLAESSGVSLASTFGLNYSFNDFAVYMKARVQTHSSDSTKAALWRFWRYGQDGESFALRYSYPTAPDSIVAVTINHDQNTLDLTGASRSTIDITLGSGALRASSTLKTTTRLGLSCNQIAGWSTGETYEAYLVAGFKVGSYYRSSTGGVTVLNLTMPNGLEKHGIQVNDVIYFDALNPSNTTLYSGPFTVSAVEDSLPTFTVTVAAGDLCESSAPVIGSAGTPVENPGTISIDSTAMVKFDPAIEVGDLVYLGSNSYGSSPVATIAKYLESTMRVEVVGDNSQWLKCSFANLLGATSSLAPVYAQLENPSGVQVFTGPTQTVAEVVAAVNALAEIADSTVPITGTVLGAGTGVIDTASWDAQEIQAYSYPLMDGLNFVQRTVAPDVIADHVQFLLKTPVTTDLITLSDWANEELYLVPQTVENVVQWFNTPSVTGLWSRAEIVNTVDGSIQITSLALGSDSGIEVLGGLANSALAPVFGSMHTNLPQSGYDASALITVKRSTATGLVANRWVSIDNTSSTSKIPTGFVVSTGGITSIDTNGKFTCSACWLTYGADDYQIEVQKVGSYVVLSFDSTSQNATGIKNTCNTGYIEIEAAHSLTGYLESVNGANQGVFPILAFSTVGIRTSIWIENSSVIEEASYAYLNFLTYNSLVPGDTITINSNDYGINNKGIWTVIAVGRTNLADASSYGEASFWVDIGSKVPQALNTPVVFTAANLPVVREGVSRKALKQILSVSPNQTDGSYVDLKVLNTTGVLNCGQSVGSVVSALDKLDFPLGFNSGSDSYRYSSGLLGAASSKIYGNPLDTTENTGWVANGATVLVSGPRIKRIQVSLAVRSTSQTQSVIDQIAASVASFINSMPMGTSIALSDIVESAKVAGVTAVSVVSPAYSSSNDVIPVAANEKPLVLSASQDIQVSFIGS